MYNKTVIMLLEIVVTPSADSSQHSVIAGVTIIFLFIFHY
jgi:hypothetical protein